MDEMKDKFLEKMIRQSGDRYAPPGFAERVMQKVETASSPQMGWSVSRLSWALSITGIAAAVAIIIFLDLSFLENIFSVQQWENANIAGLGEQLVGFWRAITETFQLSSISLIIIGSVAGLLLLDRVLRSRSDNTQYMSF